ncbi:MAG: ABC transporter permease [Planctomycetota bacterium]|jgi:ABC-type lipoprotein release transport system permease subunit
MKKSTLILRSLTHYWRTHLAVLLGVIAGTTVITGALIVGDSVRESLRTMSLDRLGGVDHALHAPRFFRQQLADDLAQQLQVSERFTTLAPALIMDAALVREADDGTVSERVGGVRVYGIDERFAELCELTTQTLPIDDGLVLSHRVSSQINAQVGDELTLWVELPATIPRESLLGGIEDQETQDVPLTVTHVLEETSGAGRFDLNPSQQLPLTVFVSLEYLQDAIGLSEVRRSREFPDGRPARINGLFLSSYYEESRTTEMAIEASALATRLLKENVQLADLSLRSVVNDELGYLAIESEQMVLEDAVAEVAKQSANELGWRSSSAMVYLVNRYGNPNDDSLRSMYSMIAGVNFSEVAAEPFGPLLTGNATGSAPGTDEIVINDWLANDLQLGVGDTVEIDYHLAGSHGELPEETRQFRVHSIVPLGTAGTASDRSLTPEVRGITDAKTFRDWKQPFPMDLDAVTERDDEYWERAEYGTLPKAFVSLETARSLWSSRYGSLTSVRVTPRADGQFGEEAVSDFVATFLKNLEPAQTGLAFRPVKYEGVSAASGTTDFTGLFIGFSFFVIASAMILIGLLFRLGVERRTSGIGLLEAVGMTQRDVRRLIVSEGLAVSLLGSLIGTATAIGYAQLMVFALKDPNWWGRAIGTQFLEVTVTGRSISIGIVISVVVAGLSLLAALRGLKSISTRQLLAGATEPATTAEDLQAFADGRAKWARWGFVVSIAVLIAGLVGLIPGSEAFSGLSWQMVAFFVVGILSLCSAMFQLSAWLSRDRSSAARGSGLVGTGRLGFRNASRNRSRSVLSTGLIASATFVIVAVAAGRRDPSVETPDVNSGNGGFSLVAETTTPLFDDLNTEDGRSKLGIDVAGGSDDARLLNETTAYSFRMRPGENASCLNLYQTTLPTVLGVPDALVERGGFRFIDQRKADYWKLLTEERVDGHIPVLGDMNTLMFSLHKSPGATIDLPGSDRKLVVVGMLDSSVFQGVLLMSDSNFQKLFPEQPGFRYVLLGASFERLASGGDFTDEEVTRLSGLLESSLTPYGFDAERVADRIAAFLVVQNTYLSTFQSLGGLGLLLGTLGLATVMLRNVVERREELALLRAVGFKRNGLSIMVLSENAMLLLLGLLAGTVSALLAMLPHLLSVGADTPWTAGARLLVTVLLPELDCS